MAIEIRPSGEPAAIAQAGLTIGQGERAKEERARADEKAQMAAQDRARQMAMEWDAQKMLLNSQQDFAHEQRLHQSDLEAEARAKEWEVQKMELRSQMDFQREEQERQQKLTRIDNALMTIEKEHDAGHFPDERQYRALKQYYEIQETGVDAPPIGLIQPPKEDEMDKYIKSLRDEVPPPVDTSGGQIGGQVRVISPDGVTGKIPIDEWERDKNTAYKGYRLLGQEIEPKLKTPFQSQWGRKGEFTW